MDTAFFNELDAAVTVCDRDGIILFMNEKACKSFEKYGGKDLIGKSLFDCHNKNSCRIIRELLREYKSNTYTVTKNSIKRLIHQTPWYRDKELMGLIEFSVELPGDMRNYER